MVRRLLGFGVTWGLLVGLWLLLVSGASLPELLAGVLAGLITTVAAFAALRALGVRYEPRVVWLWDLRRLPWLVLTDTALAARVLVRTLQGRPPQSRYVALGPLPIAGGDPQVAARRGVYTVAGSVPPGTIVVSFDEETGSVLVHQLVAGPPSLGVQLR